MKFTQKGGKNTRKWGKKPQKGGFWPPKGVKILSQAAGNAAVYF